MIPLQECSPASREFEDLPMVKATGFREYDARWWIGFPGNSRAPEINLVGVSAIGEAIGTLLSELGVLPRVVVGHDYRSYSLAVKTALAQGLVSSGCEVLDIGLALSPMAYFAQFHLDVPAVAMVTASHNENGWTGIKMGCDRPVTFGPSEMSRLKEIVLAGISVARPGGSFRRVKGLFDAYRKDLACGRKLSRRIKAVCACGNGTAGAFAPSILEDLGVEVVPLHVELDSSFPNHNPNPEDMAMLHTISRKVVETGADIGLGFDGDGDRCGIVDNAGNEIFSDKIGVLLARHMASEDPGARFVVDVKSTCLFDTDPVLAGLGARTDSFKTGHSYIKSRVRDLGATAGFEKSGHFFFAGRYGRGYDDALVTARTVLEMLARNPSTSLAEMYASLPTTWGSPTMSAECPDETKYGVVDRAVRQIVSMSEAGEPLAGSRIVSVNTINGVRVQTEDGTWGLIRASSNKPEIVVVVESPVSETRSREIFADLDRILRADGNVGPYNQTL